MTKYAIVTPTFQPHFIFIKKYLKSFSKYLQDKENVKFYFTIAKEELYEFQKITQRFPDLNISILIFEDILEKFGITESSRELLDKYNKFSFQTLKKFYTMLYIPEQYSLILDSESMAIRPLKIKELFENFFVSPFISGSEINNRYWSQFSKEVNNNVNQILNAKIPFFFLENFVWFYDKKILKSLFKEHGNPIELVEKIYNQTEEKSIKREAGIFEIELYQAYVWKNLHKNKYRFIDVTEVLKNILSSQQWNIFMSEHDKSYQGNCGLLERSTELLKVLPIEKTANWFKQNNYNIIRCNHSDFQNYRDQKTFINIVDPYILAASQDHCFGINSSFKNRCLVLCSLNNNYIHMVKHWNNFILPIKKLLKPFYMLLQWVIELVSTFIYCLKYLYDAIRNLDLVIGK